MKKNKYFLLGFVLGAIITSTVGVFAYNSKIVEAVYDDIKIALNDNYIDTGADEPFIVNGRTYIPARYVAEAMGGNVSWDAEKRIVNINTSRYLNYYLNMQKNKILLNPTENEQLYLRISEILAEYVNNGFGVYDETLEEMNRNQFLYDSISSLAALSAFLPDEFAKSFSEFWTKERAEKYSDIFNELNECFNIVYNDDANRYELFSGGHFIGNNRYAEE